MDVVLGPDVFVNASVALGSPPELVVRRLLGGASKAKTSEWVLGRTAAMLRAIPSFREDAIEPQLEAIRGLTEVVERGPHEPDAWRPALTALARAAGASRVLTDHPDLLAQPLEGSVEFVSCEAWLVERQLPPPMPSGAPRSGKR